MGLILAGGLLSGCNLAPKYVRPQAAVPVKLSVAGEHLVATTDAPDISRIGWRDFFVDPRLRTVIETGLANNQDLVLAVANVQQARAQLRARRADMFPTVSGNGAGTYTNTASFAASNGGAIAGSVADIQYFSGNVGVSSFELDLFGRLQNLSKAAQEQYLATEEAQKAARVSLIGEVASAWLTLASDREQLKISQSVMDAYQQTLELTSAQFRIGIVSELEMRQAETNYQSARNDIAVLKTQIAQDINALELLTGVTLPIELLPEGLGEQEYTIGTLPGELNSKILLRRPDVLQAEHQLIAQNANIGAARAAFFPQISLTATVGTISSALGKLLGTGTGTYTVSPTLSVPLFDFGKNQGNLEYAKAARIGAIATYQKTIQIAFREVSDALAQRGTMNEQMSAQTARVNSAKVAAELAGARFRAGADSILVALDAQRSAYAAQQQLVTTKFNRTTNLVTLYQVLGGGLE
ncbi:efflux transporter outer membrane subunit [Novosphingobium sp.]|uniref:efflux transporter outer membrane subunit n=1 Tax=Novosphingobium sp. TaxID=1874826 RepID=UPI002624E313|nr:efflux transporter outer membrane subunit [Novosphingobium sp.]